MSNRPCLALPALFAALLGTGIGAYAQTAPTAAPPAISTPVPGSNPAMRAHERRGSRMMRTLQALGLSDSQKAQIKAARQSYRTSRNSATPETKAQLRTQIENTLTPAQRTQFEAAMQRKRGSRSEPMAPMAPPTP